MVKVVAFDFDGTMALSFNLINKCIKEVFEENNLYMSEEEFFSYYGPNEIGIFKHALGDELGEKVFSRYLELYKKYHKEYLPSLAKDVTRVIDYLKENNIHVVLLTGRSLESTLISLNEFNMMNTFEKLYVGSEEGVNKPSNFKQLFKDYDVSNNEVIYIGDSVKDIYSCKEVGVKILSIYLEQGESRLDKLKENNDLVFTDYLSLLDKLKELIKQ